MNDRLFKIAARDLLSTDDSTNQNPNRSLYLDEDNAVLQMFCNGCQYPIKEFALTASQSQDPNDGDLDANSLISMQNARAFKSLGAADLAALSGDIEIVAAPASGGLQLQNVMIQTINGTNAINAGANALLITDGTSTLVDFGTTPEADGSYCGKPAIATGDCVTAGFFASAAGDWSGGDGATPGYVNIALDYTTVNPG